MNDDFDTSSNDQNNNKNDDDDKNASTSTSTSATTTTQQQQQQQQQNSSSMLLTCAFNQDGGCLAVGTTSGFSVHNLHPQYSLSVERELRGGIAKVEMLFRCNLMAIVGGGPTPHSAPHRVLIWDDHVPKEIGELSFRQPVLSVKLRKDAIAVALRDRVYVYHLADLSLRDKIYTADNPHGLLSLSTQVSDMVLACPSVTTGHVRVELYGLRKTVLLEAHTSELRNLCLTANGNWLATASGKGTLLRVWNVATSTCVYEFRRGVERATITCLAFSWDDQWLSCCSDKGTAHVFYCEPKPKPNSNNGNDNSNNNGKKKKSSLSKLFSSAIYASSSSTTAAAAAAAAVTTTKSVCQIRGIPHPLACAFVGDNNNGCGVPNMLAVAGWDADGNGVLLVSEFAAHQEARRIAYHVLVKSKAPQNQGNSSNNSDGGQYNNNEETEEQRRRRRARGWKPSIPETPNSEDHQFANLQISEQSMNHILMTNDLSDEDDDGFCEILVNAPPGPLIEEGNQVFSSNGGDAPITTTTTGTPTTLQQQDYGASSQKDSQTLPDSVGTEPVDDPDEDDNDGSGDGDIDDQLKLHEEDEDASLESPSSLLDDTTQ